jgi:fibronectin-binding autotransporter adhesin
MTLSGTNTYSGGTAFNGGILAVSSDSNLGTGSLKFSGGTLEILTGITSSKAIALQGGGGTILADAGTTSTFSGTISNAGALTKNGAGILILSGNNTYSGATTVSVGTLQAGSTTGFSTNSAFTVTSVLDLNGFSNNVGSLAGGGSVTNKGGTSATLTAGGDNTTTVFSGALNDGSSSSLGLNKNGTGMMTLSGTNTYSGGTVFNAGTLAISSDSSLGTGSLKFSGGTLEILTGITSSKAIALQAQGGTILADAGTTSTFSGAISNGGALTKNGAGILILSGNNTYSGATTVSVGTLQAGSTTGFSTNSDFTVNSVLDLNGFSNNVASLGGSGTVTNGSGTPATLTTGVDNATTTFSGTLTEVSGSGLALNKVGVGTMTLSGTNSYSGGTTFNGGILAVSSDNNLGTGPLKFSGGALEILVGITSSKAITLKTDGGGGTILTDSGTTSTLSGVISNVGALTKSGAGTLILSGNNTYSGSTMVSAGTLQAGSTTGFSSSSDFTVNSVLDLNGFSNAVASLAGAGTGIVINNANTGALAILTAGDSTITTFSGTLTDGSNSLGFTKTGSGTLILTGVNNYSGGTTISAGTLQIGSGGAAGSLTGNVLDQGTLAFNRSNTVTFGGDVSGTGTLSQIGGGTTTLTGNSTYSGVTTVSVGTLLAGSTTGLSTSSAFTVNSVLDLNGFSSRVGSLAGSGSVTNNGGISAILTAGLDNTTTVFSGTLTDGTSNSLQLNKNGTGTMTLSGTNTYSGGTTFNGGILAVSSDSNLGTGSLKFSGGTLELLAGITSSKAITLRSDGGGGTILTDTGTTSTFSGAISNVGGLTKNGAGLLILSGNNSYSGVTTVSVGKLLAGSTTGFSSSSAFTVNSLLDLNGFSNTVASLAGSGTVTDGGSLKEGTVSPLTPTGSPATLTAGGDGTSTVFSGTLIDGTSSLGLTKTGVGTLTLTGTNTYTGGTTVTAGTLQVDGGLGNTGLTVQSGASLAGQGTIAGSVTILDGGHLAPGPGAKTLSVGSLALNSGSILDYQLSTPGVIGSGVNSLVNVAGNLTLEGVLNVTNGGNFGSGSYRLLNYTGALTDLTLGLGTLPVGFSSANVTVTTAVAGQVNLVVNGAGAPTQFWEGQHTVFDSTVHGGTGTWDNFTTNFTNGTSAPNQAWQNGVAVFSAASGTVTLGADILFQGIQFLIDGYTVAGAGAFALHPTGTATITADGGVTATIAAPIVGTGGLNKAGLGLLTLSGENTYSGGTTVSGGVLSVAADTNLGGSSGVLTLNGGELVAGNGFSSSRTVALTANGGTLAAATAGEAIFSGNLTGAGSLTIGDAVNTGTVALAATNTYLGSTIIVSGATLQALSTTALSPASAFTVTGTLDVNGFSNQVGSLAGSGVVTNGGSARAVLTTGALNSSTLFGGVLENGTAILDLTKAGSGTLKLSGANSYSGATTVTAGTLQAGSLSAFSPNSAFTVNGVLDLRGFSNAVGSLAGSGTVTNSGGPGPVIIVTPLITPGLPAILTVGSDGTSTVFSGTLTNGTLPQIGVEPLASGNSTLALTKTGVGTLTLTGTNTYSGGTTFNGGIVAVDSDDNLGAGALKFNAGALEALTAAGGITSSKAVTLLVGGGTLIADATTVSSLNGVISGVGSLTKSGSGELVLTAAETYSGGTTISLGVLSLGNGGASGSIVGNVLDNGTLVFNRSDNITFAGNITGAGDLRIGNAVNTDTVGLSGTNTYLGSTTVLSGTTLRAFSETALSPESAFIVEGTLDVNGFANEVGSLAGGGAVTNGDTFDAVLTAGGDNSSTVFSGILEDGTDPLGLTKVGSGTLILSGSSTYSDPTTVAAGTLEAGSVTALSPSSAFTVNGVLDLDGFSNTVGSLAGNGTVTNGGLPSKGIAPLQDPMVGPAVLTAGGDGTSTIFSGVLRNGVGSLGLAKVGGGTLTLTGTNTYTAGTTVTAGILQIGNGAASGSIVGDVINNASLVVNRTGTLTLAGVVSGTGNLSQVGTGTLVLKGNSTYTGTTAVSAGTLQVDGGLGDTALTVQSGATLAGQGTITGSVTILDGGHLAPGSGAEPLGVGSLVLNSGAILDYQLSTPGVIGSGVNTLVNVTGNLTLDGVLNVANGGNFGSGFYRLLNYSGALTNNTLDLGTLPVGFSSADVTVTTAVAGQVNLVVNAAGAPAQFWDGSNTVNDLKAHGGNGTWDNFTTNFTNIAGTINEAWQNGIAIFAATFGTVTLGSDILFQGMTFVSSDYAVVGDVSGSFALHPTGLATITTDSGVTATIAAPIVGGGGLKKAGPGLLVLTGANTYSGGTTVSGGTLSVGSDTNLGDPSVGITLDGGELLTSADFTSPRTVALVSLNGDNILAAKAGTTATYTGVISGTTALLVGDFANQGTVVLSNPNNSYSGGTNVLPGTLVAAATGTLATGAVQMFGGTLMILAGVTLSNEVMFVQGGVLNNAGTLNNNVLDEPEKTVTLVNSGIINGNVNIGGTKDTVQLLTGSRITGNLTLNGSTSSTLILDGAGQQLLSLAVAGTVTNNGTLVKQGSGTWTIDRALAAPLGTDILAGTLIVEAALTTAQVDISPGATLQLNGGGTVGSLVDNGSLNFSSSDTVTFATVITGPGSVIQNGTGITILSGRNTYTGGTIIDLGTLLVDNAQALGTGNVTVNGGVLGADPQPINVLGNYTQNAGGTLQLNIAGRASGQFDVLNVAGSAVLNGTLRLLNLGYQPQRGDKLQLVTAGGSISGRFATFQNPFTTSDGFNTIDLVYARNSVTLEFLQTNSGGVGSTTEFKSFATTPNQGAAASLLDAVQQDPRGANLFAFLDKLPFADLPNAFHEISTEEFSSFYEISFSNANIQRLNLESRMDDLHNGSNGFSSNMKVNSATVNVEERVDSDGKSTKAAVEPILQPGPGNRWGVWMTGFGDFVSVDGDANANGYNFTTGGVSLGIDYRLTDELVVGVMAEYSHTWTSLKPSGSNDVNSGRGGLYATWSHHGFYLNGAIYGGYNSYNSSRSALQGLASGNTEGAELSTFISGGYDFHFGLLTVGPIAALQYTYANIDGFSESGSLAPMQIQSGSANSLRSDVGFRLFDQWMLGKVIIEPSLKAAWEHEYLYSALPITAGFANIPGPTATFTGPAEGHDSAIVSAGVSVIWTPTLTTYLNYDGQLGRGNYSSNAVTGGVRISF